MKDDSLDQVIGGVRNGDDVGACLDAGAIEKRVAERPGGRLERTPRQGLGATLGYQADSQSITQLGHLPRNVIGAFAQRVVVMGRHDIAAGLMQCNEESGRVGAARDRDEDSLGGELSHGGAGWTRTTDNAIMSRALYHLSYGTAVSRASRPAWIRAFSLRFFFRCLSMATRFLLFISFRHATNGGA